MNPAVNMSDNRVLSAFGRFSLYVDARDVTSAPRIIHGNAGADTIALLAELKMERRIAVHVGGQFGHKTVHIAEAVGKHGGLFVFEPNPRAFALLRCNLDLNEMPWARLYPNAAGAVDGQGEILMHRRRFDSPTLNPRVKGKYGEQEETAGIYIVRLDTILSKFSRVPDFMFISANGCEPEVMAGATKLIAENKKMTVLLSFRHELYDNPLLFATSLFEAGFNVFTLDKNRFLDPSQLVRYRGKLLLVR